MKRLIEIVGLLVVFTSLVACDGNTIFEENLKIKDSVWNQNEKAYFEFDIQDSTIAYEIYMNFRHGGNYPYKNIYLFTRTVSPSGLIAKDTAQMLLADNKGRWLGKGIGDIFDYQFKYKAGNLFPESGTYTFEIEQAMREESLENVTDIGIAIKKLNKE